MVAVAFCQPMAVDELYRRHSHVYYCYQSQNFPQNDINILMTLSPNIR